LGYALLLGRISANRRDRVRITAADRPPQKSDHAKTQNDPPNMAKMQDMHQLIPSLWRKSNKIGRAPERGRMPKPSTKSVKI
jgi:hypothetical protein